MTTDKLDELDAYSSKIHNGALGYGLSKQDIMICLSCIPNYKLKDFMYTLYRAAEKGGCESFEL